MTGNMKRLVADSLAAVAVFAGTAFVTWGFDPANWQWSDRLIFVCVLLFALFFAGCAPFEDDRP